MPYMIAVSLEMSDEPYLIRQKDIHSLIYKRSLSMGV